MEPVLSQTDWKSLAVCLMAAIVGPEVVAAGPIHDAAQTGDVASLTALIDSGSDINETSPVGTALSVAVWTQQRPAVEFLLSSGADPDIAGLLGTPLQIAITRGFTDIAGVLLSSGANPNVGEKRTPLFIAVNKGNIDAIRLLLAAGADPDAAASLDLETPIHEAAHLGNQSMVRMLIEAGADPNVLTARRQHALHLALFYGRTELAEYLKPLTTLEFDPEPVTDHIDDVDMKAAEEYVRWHCGYCHQLGQLTDGDKAGPGPRLWSMEGLPKGSDPDFEYSPGMFSSKVDWSEDELNRWLAGAPLVVPGTLMDVSPYAPMTDPETRAAVIAFLRTLGTPTDR